MEIAKSSDCIVWKDNFGTVNISRKSTNGLVVAMFVTALVGTILLVNGIIFLTVELEEGINYPLALSLIAAGILDLVMFTFFKRLKKKKEGPEHYKDSVIVSIKNTSDVTIKNTGNTYHLGDVSLKRKFQIGSSSPKLVLVTPNEEVVLVHGTPFGGGLSAVENYLKNIIPSAR